MGRSSSRIMDQAMALIHSQNQNYLGGFVVISIAGYLLYRAVDTIYKRHLHPLARFPGPKEACLSQKWLLQISEEGNPEQVFEKLHEKYNARAIRIAPNELHIDDVRLYKTFYGQTSAYLKDEGFYGGFGTDHTLFVEHIPSLHKERRRRLNPFFSRRAVGQLESLLKDKVTELGGRIDTQSGPYNIFNAVRCTTVDIISHYCAGQPLGQLEKSDENFNGDFLEAFDSATAFVWKFIYQPTLRLLITSIPASIAKAVSRETRLLLSLIAACHASSTDYKRSPPQSEHPAIFSGLADLEDKIIGDEATDLLIAGSDTTAFSLAAAIVQIALHTRVKTKLVEALDARGVDAENLPSLVELEQIEYLNATVREAVRFAIAVPGRLPRVVPHDGEPLIVDGRVVPAGTIVGMSAYTMNFSKELWGDDAAVFNPDRWLVPNGKSLDTHMCSFSKGLRSCIGQNLAFAEIHYILAYLFAKYDVDLLDKEAEIEVDDRFTTHVRSKAVMVDLRRRQASMK